MQSRLLTALTAFEFSVCTLVVYLGAPAHLTQFVVIDGMVHSSVGLTWAVVLR